MSNGKTFDPAGREERYRCGACGRFFDTEGELRTHEPECRSAKQATESGTHLLERDEHMPHPTDDRGL